MSEPYLLTLTDTEGCVIDRWDMEDDEDVFHTLIISDGVANSTRRAIERVIEKAQAAWEE